MKRRSFLLGLAAVSIGLPSVSLAAVRSCCPLCGGALLGLSPDVYESIPDLEDRNRDVSDMGASHVCTKCFLVFFEGAEEWSQTANEVGRFFVPMDKPILNFPLPHARDIRSKLVYSQKFRGLNADKGLAESVGLWVTDSEAYFAEIRHYAAKHSIGWEMALEYYAAPSQPKQTWIQATVHGFHSSRFEKGCPAA